MLRNRKKIIIIAMSIIVIALGTVITIKVIDDHNIQKALDQKRADKTQKIRELRDQIRIDMRSQDPDSKKRLIQEQETLDELLHS